MFLSSLLQNWRNAGGGGGRSEASAAGLSHRAHERRLQHHGWRARPEAQRRREAARRHRSRLPQVIRI